MEYSINKLAKLAGVSTRTLRYYDEIDLLTAKRINSNDYRIYGQQEVDLLQQILFFRELGVPLEEIKKIIHSEDYDNIAVLQEHLIVLKTKQKQIDSLINNVEKTIAASKGEIDMNDNEKFEAFKQNQIDINEKKFGQEIREKYGDDRINASNAKMIGMTLEQQKQTEELSKQLNETLKKALQQGNPASELAQKACSLHKEWLTYFWRDYSKEAHLGLTQLYLDDTRFKKYYDSIAIGSAEFLHKAMKIYCQADHPILD